MAIPSLAVSAGAESPVRAAIMKRCCRRNSIGGGEASLLTSPYGSIHFPLLFQLGAFQTSSEALRVVSIKNAFLTAPSSSSAPALSRAHHPSCTQLAETILETCSTYSHIDSFPICAVLSHACFFPPFMLCVILLFIRFLCLSQNIAHCLL